MSVGGYDVECVDEISKDFYCIICLKLMRNAIQMNCGHGMCRTCFDEMINSYQQRNAAPICPSCRLDTSPDQVVQVSMVDRMISALKVICQAHDDGCEWIGELSNMQVHNLECNYRKVACPITGCNELIQYSKISEHTSENCNFVEHDCSFKEFGCTEKMKNVDKHFHEGDANHLMLFQQLLKEKDAEIEKLKKENETLKDKQASFEEMSLKLNDIHTLLKNKQTSNDVTAINAEVSTSKSSSILLNDSNGIFDEIKSKFDLVGNLMDENLIRNSILTHQFLRLENQEFKLKCTQNLIDSLYKTLPLQVSLVEEERQRQKKLRFSEWQNYFSNFCVIERSVCNLKIHLMETCYQQIMYIKAKKFVWNHTVETNVFKSGKYRYLCINRAVSTFDVDNTFEGENRLVFFKNRLLFHTYSIKEVMICNPDNCIELEPTICSSETFDTQMNRTKRVFTTKRQVSGSWFDH